MSEKKEIEVPFDQMDIGKVFRYFREEVFHMSFPEMRDRLGVKWNQLGGLERKGKFANAHLSIEFVKKFCRINNLQCTIKFKQK